jgi:hypothetical protein
MSHEFGGARGAAGVVGARWDTGAGRVPVDVGRRGMADEVDELELERAAGAGMTAGSGVDTPPPAGDEGGGELGEFTSEEMARIRRMDVQNIKDKAARGEVLTREQLKRLDLALKEGEPSEGLVDSQEKLATALSVADRKTIQRWLKEEGCPGKTEGGLYDVRAWKLWAEGKGKRAGTKTPSAEKLKEKQLSIEVQLKQLELDEAHGRVIKREECLEVLEDLITKVTQQFRALKHDLAPRVVGETVAEAGVRIGDAVDEVLQQLAGIPEAAKKKTFWRTVSLALSAHLQRCLLSPTPNATSRCITATSGTPT